MSVSYADRDCLLGRADQGRRLAAQAFAEVAREIHLELASEYQRRANCLSRATSADNDVLAPEPRIPQINLVIWAATPMIRLGR